MTSRDAFGPNLRRLRQRRGISLHELSFRTKVSLPLWEAMENNDFSQWPTGVAARAHIRAYAEVIGVDPNACVDEFCRVAPHGDRRAERLIRETAELLGHQLTWSDDLPPALAEGDRRASTARPDDSTPPWCTETNLRRLAAGLDFMAVTVLAGGISAGLRIDFWVALAVIALLYHGASLVLLGGSPAVCAADLYASTQLPVRRHGDLRAFRHLTLKQNEDPSPNRHPAA